MVSRIRVKAERWRWLLRYWVLDKYRVQIFVAAAVLALAAFVGLVLQIWG